MKVRKSVWHRLITLLVWLAFSVVVSLGSRVTAHSNTVGILWSGNQPTGTCVSGTIHALNCSLVEIFFGSWHNAGTPQTGTLSIYRQNLGGGETEVIGPSVTPPAINFQVNHSKIATLPNFATSGAAWTQPVQSYSNKASAAYAALATEFVLGGNYFWGGASGLVGDPITKKYPEDSEKNNFHEIKFFINSCNKKNLDKLIFISTCSNYGIVPEGVLADENYELRPLSSYAKHKVEIEKYIMSLDGKIDYSPTILRFATAFGLSSRMRFDLTVNQFTKELFDKNKLEIYDQETWRPYCHVKDFARLIDIVIKNPKEKTHFQIYNAGSDENNFTKKKIVEEIINVIPDSKFVFSKNDVDKRNYKVNFNKVKKELNFSTKYSVQYGIKEIVQAIKDGLFKNIEIENFGNYNIKT